MGVRKIKYTKNIIIGAIINPRISPNFIQSLFNGERKFEFNKPRTKKIIPTEIDQIRI